MDKNYELKKLLELYSLCNEPSIKEDAQTIKQLPSEDRAWLFEAIKSDFIDPVQKMKDNIAFINTKIINRTTDDNLAHSLIVIEELHDITLNMDYAHDFVKLHGLEVIEDLLRDQNVSIQCKASELLGNLNQNNLFCQSESINRNIIEKLVDKISHENDIFLLKKLIYALSCTVRGNENAVERFIQTNGFDFMMNLIQASSSSAIRCKIAFFIYCLCSELETTQIEVKRIEMCLNSFSNCVLNLKSFTELETEHLLGSLYFILKSYANIHFNRRVELLNFLNVERTKFNDYEVFDEVVFYTNEIYTILYNRCMTINSH